MDAFILEILIIGALGAMAAVLAHSSVAVFNDGLRPIVPQYLDGTINRKALGATSFALGFGLVIGFGIPTSIAGPIILIHCIFLATDIIGTSIADTKLGKIIAAISGAVLGIGLVFGLEFVLSLFEYLPYNFLSSLGKIGAPIVIGFSVFPALAIAYQHGFSKALITFLAQFIALVLAKQFGSFEVNGANVAISPEGVTLLVGMGLLLYFAIQVKSTNNSNQQLISVFQEKVLRIKKFKFVLAIMGGLVAAATSLALVAGDPVSLALTIEGNYTEAAMAAFARGVGFIPLVFSTAIVSGVYGPAGTTLVFAIGVALINNPILAFIFGFLFMLLEVSLINVAAKTMDKYPGVRDMGENIRTSMNKVLEVALLVGGAIACEEIAPGIGYFWIIGIWWLNQTAKKPLVKLAVGPVSAISLGVLMNVLTLLGLWTPIIAG